MKNFFNGTLMGLIELIFYDKRKNQSNHNNHNNQCTILLNSILNKPIFSASNQEIVWKFN